MSEGGREEGRKVSEGGRGGGSELLTCWGERRGAGTAIGGLWYCRLATRVEHMSHRKLCRTDGHTPGGREGGGRGRGREGGGGGREGGKEGGGRKRQREREREREKEGWRKGRKEGLFHTASTLTNPVHH